MNASIRWRGLAAVATAIACVAGGCTSATTSVTAPTADKCQVSVSTAPGSFPANGGSGMVTVTAARDCPWSMATNASWVTLAGDASGQGDASVGYTVAANPTAVARSGAITVASQTLQLSQAGAPCRFALSRTEDAIAASGGRLSTDVSTLAGCLWTASTAASWISIVSGTGGNGSATVLVSVAANTGPARVGVLNVAGQNYTVDQAAATPAPAPTPSPSPAPSPSPPSSQPVTFTGVVLAVSGRCPDLSMNVGSRDVTTNSATKFKDMKCTDVRIGISVSVDGTMDASGVVTADVVQKVGG